MRVPVGTALLVLAPALAHADEGDLTLGVAGGTLITDPLEILGPGPTFVPRVGYEFRENAVVELDLGVVTGKTRRQSVGYFGLTPRVNFKGILIDEVIAERSDDGMHRMKRAPIQPFLVAGIGAFYKNVSDADAVASDFPNPDVDLIVDGGPGVQVPIGDALMLRTDYRVVANLGTEWFDGHGDTFLDWEWTLGVDVVLGGRKDSDDDGISDKYDDCIAEPEDLDGFADADGCPDADNDEDGIADADDACPDEAEDADGFEDTDGCPDTDNDEDGIADTDDACPDEAGVATASGCPDADADGIADADDACPDLPGTPELDGCVDTDGDTVVDPEDECPDEAGSADAFGCPDGDGDRVPDHRDDCPDEAAHEGTDPLRSDGCPSRVYVTEAGIAILEKVFFESGRATIQRRSLSLLDEVAATLDRYPGITRVEVQGHTDAQGDDEANLALSQSRAEAVVTYLVGKGIAVERLVAKGYGETRPIDDNDTRDGRANNRRVEFRILEQTTRVTVRPASAEDGSDQDDTGSGDTGEDDTGSGGTGEDDAGSGGTE